MKINLGKIQDVSDLNPMRINKLISDLEKALLRVPDVKEQDTVYLTKDNAVTGINSYTKAQTYSGGIEVNTLPLALVGAPINYANIVTVASATAPAIGAAASNNISISGTTQIDGFDDVAVGITRNIVFEGILQLTHSATLVLPTGANITTAAGDTCMAQQIATGTQGWRIFSYQRADGTALVEAAASATVSGIVELATEAEVQTGTDTSRVPSVSTMRTGLIVLPAAMVSFNSAATYDVTGIPSWVKRITIFFFGVSTTGGSHMIVQIGDSGGIETTGYSGCAWAAVNAASPSAVGFGSALGFDIDSNTPGASTVRRGKITLELMDAATFTWVCDARLGNADQARASGGWGAKQLTAALDRFTITTIGGTETWDAGSIGYSYE